MQKIFISRPVKKNGPFCTQLAESGMEIIGQSLIQFSLIPFHQIPKVDWIFFYSKKGVEFFMEQVNKSPSLKNKIKSVRWAVMGKGTATALSKFKNQADFIGTGQPKETASLFQKIADKQKVLFVRAKDSKKSIQQLVQQQVQIVDFVVYDNQIKTSFKIPYCHYLVFTSPLNAVAYYHKYPIDNNQKVIAIGKTTAQKLTELGINEITIAQKPTEQNLAEQVLTVSSQQFPVTKQQQTISNIQHPINLTNKYAVIDLGTNTFHLLVAEKWENQPFKEVHRQRFFVKLAEEGIETIGKAPIQRGLNALKTFSEVLDKLNVKQVKALGTAALRTASNGPAFIKKVKQDFDIEIELIDGNREAELIYKGTILAVPFKNSNYLIMDIGGGSVEFIIANNQKVYWAQSFPIGVAVLYKKFHQEEPISPQSIKDVQVFINNFLLPLYHAIIQFPVTTLVGASGTFDVLEFILAKNQTLQNHAFVKAEDFQPLYQLLIESTKEERFKMKEVPDTRADMIVVAVILIDFILRKTQIEDIIVSNFALKEGVLSELMS